MQCRCFEWNVLKTDVKQQERFGHLLHVCDVKRPFVWKSGYLLDEPYLFSRHKVMVQGQSLNEKTRYFQFGIMTSLFEILGFNV